MKTLLLFLLIFFNPIPIFISISYNETSKFNLKINGLKTRKTKAKDKEEKEKNNIENLRLIRKLLHLYPFSYYKPIVFIKLNNEYGFEDPAYTGISYGAINYAIAEFLILIKRYFHLKIHKINIVPHWNKKKAELNLNLLFIFSVFNIVIYIILFLYYKVTTKIKRSKKRRLNYGKWQ